MKNRKKLNFYLISIIAFISITILIFFPYSINIFKSIITNTNLNLSNQFIIKYDYGLQHIPFYQEFFNQLDSGQIGWSWNQLFGINFYASKGYYMIGDPFAYLSYFLRSYIPDIINNIFFVTMIKLVLSGFSFSYMIGQFTNKNWIRILFSCIYITCGWCTTFIEQPNFISFFVFAPILIASFEKVLNHKNSYVLISISATILLCINYYLTWMLCVYILIYWILKQVIINKTNLKEFFKESFVVLFYFLIGVGISSIIWLPSLLHLTSNPRLGNTEIIRYNWYNINDIVNIIKNIYVPVLKFENSVYKSDWYYFNQIGIYTSLLSTLLIPLFALNKKINTSAKKCYLLLLIICLLTFISPQVSKIFHFTYSLRYTYIIMITISIISSMELDNIANSYSVKQIKIIGLANLIILALVGLLVPYIQNYRNSIEIYIIYLALALLIIYILILILSKNRNKILSSLISCLVIFESILMGFIPIYSQRRHAENYITYITKEDEYQSIINQIKNNDPSFYRFKLNEAAYNEGLYYNIPTISTYDTMYEYSIRDFLDWIHQYPDVNWNFIITLADLYAQLDVKYLIFEDYNQDAEYYSYFANEIEIKDSDYYVCKLNNQASFGRLVTSLVTEDEFNSNFDEYSYLHEIGYYLANNYVVDSNTYNELSNISIPSKATLVDPTIISNNHFTIDIEVDDNYLLYLSVPNDKGWKYTNNDKNMNTYKIQGGFTGIKLKKGNNHIEAIYKVPGLDISKYLTICSFILLVLVTLKRLIDTNQPS